MLFFDGCPNVEVAIGRARQATESDGGSAELHLVRGEGEADAVARAFLGSPTVRVDGRDVDGSADARTDFGLQCRVYSVDGHPEGAPPVAWVEAELRGSTSLAPRPFNADRRRTARLSVEASSATAGARIQWTHGYGAMAGDFGETARFPKLGACRDREVNF